MALSSDSDALYGKLKVTKLTNTFSGQKLSYYFDQVKKDSSDLQASASQWDEWLRLRPKVLKLPTETFKITLAAVEAILEHAGNQGVDGLEAQERQSKNHQAASALYEGVRKEIRKKDLSVKTAK